MYRHILVPTDGTKLSQHAVEAATSLARSLGSRITFMTVTEPFHTFTLNVDQVEDTRPEYERHVTQKATHILDEASSSARRAGLACDVVHAVGEHPHEEILDASRKRGCDLIVMASHGRRGMAALVLGSETLKVLTHSKIPVLVVRAPDGSVP